MSRLDTDILNVLDLLYDKFRIEPKKNHREDGLIVAIFDHDLKNNNLDSITAGEAITALNNYDKEIDFFKLFNEDDYHIDLLNGEYPSIYEVRLPKDFDKKYRKLRNYYDNNSKDNLKILITISNEEGIYKNNELKPNYPAKGKRMKLIFRLKTGKISGNELAKDFYKNDFSILSKEIKSINKNFTSKLNLEYDLILHLDTSGYALNKNNYRIDFVGVA